MSLQDTPQANRLQIALLGKRNAGKSSLLNALTGQDVSVVSDTPGTTTDLVHKAMEIAGIGPCLFIDTPGYDDEGDLGKLRVGKTRESLEKADMVLLLCDGSAEEKYWVEFLKQKHTPIVYLLAKADITDWAILESLTQSYGEQPIPFSSKTGQGISQIRQAILEKMPSDFDAQDITRGLVGKDDVVLLVMPQDIQAPKGRLILPQVQTLRELLDKKCVTLCCTTDRFQTALQALASPPKLIITDSQAFDAVYRQKPEESMLTSFSVLFAAYKGDIDYFVQSARTIGNLNANSKVLIAEACTHAPQTEDIGRVKIPAMLRKRFGTTIQIEVVSGNRFPEDLSAYDLIIHCGACMFNRKHVLSRVERARQQGIPMTNYGVTIACLTGILDKIRY